MRMPSLVGLVLAFCVGCGPAGERVLFLRSGDADLPILVRGAEDSSSLVVFVHGGPGGSGLVYAAAMSEAFDPVSAKALLAFYDQRGSGSAQGNVSASQLTLRQHVQDLDDVLALLRAQYPGVTKVFLLGHSWGGTLTAAYLADPARAASVAGWIDVAGSTSFPRTLELSRSWASERAQAKAAERPGEAKWRDLVGWYGKNASLNKGNLPEHMSNVDALGGTTFDPSSEIARTTDALFFSPYSAGADLHNAVFAQQAMADELMDLDLHPALAHVTLPSLLMFGAHDGRVPMLLGEEALAALGTPDADKRLMRFEKSAHRPFNEEPAKFAAGVVAFVEALR